MLHRLALLACCLASLTLSSVAGAAPPRSAATLKDLVSQTGCVAEGDVTSITTIFDGWFGPRTVVTLSNVVPRLGTCPAGPIDLVQAGGPLPDGGAYVVPQLPHFNRDSHYLVFLRNTDWHWSPLLFRHAYRVETVAGKRVLIDQSGHALQRLDVSGLVSGSVQLFETYDPAGDSFARPPAVAGVTADQVAPAITPDLLVTRLASYAEGEGLSFGGAVSLTPVQTHAWNRVPAAVAATPPGNPGCTNPLGCP